MDPKKIEKELNDYPVVGFKFKVNEMDVSQDISMLPEIRFNVSAHFVLSQSSIEGMVTWFYLALSDYASKHKAHLEIIIDEESDFTVPGKLTMQANVQMRGLPF